jgi:hypothetical protein
LDDPFGCRALCARYIQIHLPTGKGNRIDAAQHDIRVGHCRFCAAAAVTHGSGVRACAIRSDDDPTKSIDAGDRAAAGTDFDHFDHRNTQRQSAAFEKSVNARHLESTRGLRLSLVDQTDFRRCATHIERYNFVEAVLPRNARSKDRSAGRSGFDKTDRKPNGRFDSGDAATRGHQQQGTTKACPLQFTLQISQIASDQRLKIRIGAGCGEPFILAHFWRHVRGQSDRDVGQSTCDCIPDPAFVNGIGEAVKKSDRYGIDGFRGKRLNRTADTGFIELLEHLALRVDAFHDREASASRDERQGQVDVDVILLEAVFVTDFDNVAKPFRRQKSGFCTLPLDQCVRRQRRSVDDDTYVAKINVCFGNNRTHRFQHAFFGCTRGR